MHYKYFDFNTTSTVKDGMVEDVKQIGRVGVVSKVHDQLKRRNWNVVW